MESVESRFLRYIKVDSMSDESSDTIPSTSGQLTMLELLRNELNAMGASNIALHNGAYLTAEIPATNFSANTNTNTNTNDNATSTTANTENRNAVNTATTASTNPNENAATTASATNTNTPTPTATESATQINTTAKSVDDKCAVTIGFLAHVDTSPDMTAIGVNPQIIEYRGGQISLNDNYSISPDIFPELSSLIGQHIIVTDGTTLLGADDKAGVAEIMTAAEILLKTEGVCHNKVCIAFTTDEEVGRGVDTFDVKSFGADYAYTVDGGRLGELEYENFNAAQARITIHGISIHPGSAKGKMINASLVAAEFAAMLPPDERPETTDNYQGFFHLTDLCGDVEKCMLNYIIRDHDSNNFARRKQLIANNVDIICEKYGRGVASTTIKDQYLNMREKIDECPQVISKAKAAMESLGITPIFQPIRGGTDGARLSYMGLPCPNIFTGGANFHGRYEYVCVESMHSAVKTIIKIAEVQNI